MGTVLLCLLLILVLLVVAIFAGWPYILGAIGFIIGFKLVKKFLNRS